MGAEKKIVIIHREGNVADSLAQIAQSFGYAAFTKLVEGATTPQEVASFVADVKPDLVLLAENYISIEDKLHKIQNAIDTNTKANLITNIKKGEGIEGVIEIRKFNKNLPIYLISGSPRYYERAIQSGTTGYLKIPITVQEFREFLSSNLQS